jgi:hypothetical protein
MSWADRLAALAPGSLRRFKQLVGLGTWTTPEHALEVGHRHAVELMGMADTIEGATAFAERRAPRFEDR